MIAPQCSKFDMRFVHRKHVYVKVLKKDASPPSECCYSVTSLILRVTVIE